MSGNFWWDFIRTYPRHLWLIVLGRSVMTLMILASVLASARILDVTNSVTAAIWLLVFYTVVQVIMKVVNAWTSLLQNQLLVCTRTFVTLRVNAKLLHMGTLSSDEFSMGNLKILISSDIYRISDFFHAIFRNGVPCVLALIILGPVVVYYMGIPGALALAVSFGALPLGFVIGLYMHKKESAIKKQEDTLATIIGEWVTNVRLLRFLSWEALMRHRVAAHIRKLIVESTKEMAAA